MGRPQKSEPFILRNPPRFISHPHQLCDLRQPHDYPQQIKTPRTRRYPSQAPRPRGNAGISKTGMVAPHSLRDSGKSPSMLIMHRQSKNSKNLIPKSQLGSLPPLTEPNHEIQMDFAGPIPFKENTQNNYILVTVDRLSRYPHAETFFNCDIETALDYLD